MITRLWKLRRLRVAGFAVGAVAIAGIAVVATASAAGMSFGFRPNTSSQSQSDASLAAAQSRASSAACGEFMSHFAVEIGKSQAQINAAFQKAIADTLADEVKAGHLTQAQADTIKKKLANQTPCSLPSLAPRGDKTAIAAYMAQYLTAAASALGITETMLKTDLKNGQSLSQVASAQKVSEADFRTKLIASTNESIRLAEESDMNVYAIAVVWIVLALIASAISIRAGVAVALAEILVGVLAGNLPFVSGLVQQTAFTTFLASVGSMVLTFLAGAEIDPVSVRRHWRAHLAICAVSFMLPFAAALAVAYLALPWEIRAAEIAGVALSTTSAAAGYAGMVENGLNRDEPGKLILAAG